MLVNSRLELLELDDAVDVTSNGGLTVVSI